MSKKYVKCPLNYVGGKTKLLPQILPLFPKSIDTFYDLFVGGANVLANVDAKKYVGYDIDKNVIELLNMFKNNEPSELLQQCHEIISKYGLSKTNAEGFYALRNDYNNKTRNGPIHLFMLLSHAFNYQIRFNSKGMFNMPFGKDRSYFSDRMASNLVNFSNILREKNVEVKVGNFYDCLNDGLNKDDLVYADPPYLNTIAVYNEAGGWTVKDEEKLLSTLDVINDMKINFALSNVNNANNTLLTEWSKKYKVHSLEHNYSNASYQKKDRNSMSAEILITNF